MNDGVTIELNSRERRLYDRLRAAVVTPRPGQGTGLRDVLLLLPDLAVLLARLLRDPRVPTGGKAIALLGPIGLLDDLFVVAATLSRILNYVHPDVVRSHWSGQGDALDAIQRGTGWAEDRVKGVLRRILPRAFRP
jgi:hypothetical protein